MKLFCGHITPPYQMLGISAVPVTPQTMLAACHPLQVTPQLSHTPHFKFSSPAPQSTRYYLIKLIITRIYRWWSALFDDQTTGVVRPCHKGEGVTLSA